MVTIARMRETHMSSRSVHRANRGDRTRSGVRGWARHICHPVPSTAPPGRSGREAEHLAGVIQQRGGHTDGYAGRTVSGGAFHPDTGGYSPLDAPPGQSCWVAKNNHRVVVFCRRAGPPAGDDTLVIPSRTTAPAGGSGRAAEHSAGVISPSDPYQRAARGDQTRSGGSPRGDLHRYACDLGDARAHPE